MFGNSLVAGRPPAGRCDDLSPAGGASVGVGILTNDFFARPPYVQQYSLGVQSELTGNMEVTYVGSTGRKLNRRMDVNQARLPLAPGEPVQPRRPYPSPGTIVMARNIAVSNHNSLQARLEKQFSHGFFFLAAYTFSKSRDTSSSAGDATSGGAGIPQNNQNKKGKSFFSSSTGPVNVLLGDWQINGIYTTAIGNPFSVQVGGADRTQTGVFGGGVQRENAAPNQRPNPDSSERRVERWFNASAFQPAPPGTFGNGGRNIVTGPGTHTLDFSILKNFRFTERTALQFRKPGLGRIAAARRRAKRGIP